MKVGILGAGAFGLALSHILVKNKVTVEMWTQIGRAHGTPVTY